MRAEIITVGSELLQGQTLDRHSFYLSQACFPLGIEVLSHTSVGDDAKRLCEVIRLAHSRAQLVFLCGGLGPTRDDLTKETLAKFLKQELVQDAATLARLTHIFADRSLAMPANNLKQTYVFPNGTVFPNEHGTAPGLAVTQDDVVYILMPGPPTELIPMFETSVRPFLHDLLSGKQVLVSQSLSFFGIGESSLEEHIRDMIEAHQNPMIASYVNEGEVTVRLVARAATEAAAHALMAPVRAQIGERVGEYCFSAQDETLEEVVVSLLKEQKRTIALAESCTGGLLTYLLSTVPGSSGVLKGGLVCYTNEIKHRLAHVPRAILDEHGAISSFTAEVLAQATCQQWESHFALSVTGVAGPNPADGKPVGTVYIGLAEKGQPTRVYDIALLCKGSRQKNQQLAVKYALFILQQRLKKGETTT
jgi:nicotinamide-nucleotide amidase